MDDEALLGELEQAGQGRVAAHLRGLVGAGRRRLVAQLRRFDFALVRELADLARRGAGPQQTEELEPAPVLRADRATDELAAARRAGEAALRDGAVAAFCVAGGQGSRLRFDGPKGCYPLGPVSGRPLFQIHAEKVLAAGRRYSARIPLYLMTSETNDDAVRAFFEQNLFFGLDPADVFFCPQRMLPAFDGDGRFLLEAEDRVFVSPDGHGGSYVALRSSGALDDLAERGVRHISYFQVDNPMVPVLDPVFIGEHVRTGSEMSSKVLAKRDPLEPLGVFGYVDGELRVIEYSDMSDDLSRATWPDGSLKHPYGSIAIHLLDVDFVRRMAGVDLPFHLARKRIPCLGEDGGRIEPDEPNGVKFERFVFDGIPYARSPLIMEVRREEEFAPVKNATGEDSPETARGAMLAQHRRWLEAAGGSVPAGCAVEISPLFALDAGGLQGKVAGLKVTGELYLE